MFKVLGKTIQVATTYQAPTHHVGMRQARYELVKQLGGRPILSVVVDKGHENGWEVHTITDQGTVYIGNYNSRKLITFLIARPEQLKRYGVTNEEVLAKAQHHTQLGYNNM